MHASWGIKKDRSRQYGLVVHKGKINIGSKYNGTIKKRYHDKLLVSTVERALWRSRVNFCQKAKPCTGNMSLPHLKDTIGAQARGNNETEIRETRVKFSLSVSFCKPQEITG